MDLNEDIKRAAACIKDSDALLFTAGAGIGVDSGLPDFRGNEGFWKAYPPIAKLGISFVDMANPRWFKTDPELAWAFYGHRLNLYRRTVPHKGFMQLMEMAEDKSGGYFVFTSNVDGQFQRAGFSDERIEECHGSIHHLQCVSVCGNDIWDGAEVEVRVNEEKFEAETPLPLCINCGRLARPNILMFGDWDWISSRSDEQSQRFHQWISDLKSKNLKPAVIEIGAGEAVPTVRMRSERAAELLNGTLIRINPRDFSTPPGNISIPLGGGEGIESIYSMIKSS